MNGKYSNVLTLGIAYIARQYTRACLRKAISWQMPEYLDEGCTVIIGMPHRLPGVLIGNLRCLWHNRWPQLRKVIVVVDSTAGSVSEDLIQRAETEFSDLSIKFVFYTEKQAAIASKLQLPYVYAWLSWCIGFGAANTKHILIHDYDALILHDILAKRYEKFVNSKASIQGIGWYNTNGIEATDRLATTFETFLDLAWVRQFRPIMLFNQVAWKNGRSLDYDILLEVQDRFTPHHARAIESMSEEDLVHPSQMVHQYTMFRRLPGKPLPCFSVAMIPFFIWLSGDQTALRSATQRLHAESALSVDLLGDGTRFNFNQLNTPIVDWNLKQMIRACEGLSIAPFGDLIAYGDVLYGMAGTSKENAWIGGFSPVQLAWIQAAFLKSSGMKLISET